MKKCGFIKIVSLMLAAVLMLSMFSLNAVADEGVLTKVKFACTDKVEDGMLILSVYMLDGVRFTALDMSLDYDTSVLEVAGYSEKGTDAERWEKDEKNPFLYSANELSYGKILYGAIFADQLAAGSDIAEKFHMIDFFFTIKSGAEKKVKGTEIKVSGTYMTPMRHESDAAKISYDYVVNGGNTMSQLVLPSQSTGLIGDVNGDKSVTAADARLILRNSVSLEVFSAEQKKKADTNADGTITASDARTVLRMSVGLEKIKTETQPDPFNYIAMAEKYSGLAINDFYHIKGQYPTATPEGAYVMYFVDRNGDQCVMTVVYYKIINGYYETTLHNLTTGKTIFDPVSRYENIADTCKGEEYLHYCLIVENLKNVELDCREGAAKMMADGTDIGKGVFVDAKTLALDFM